MHRCCQILLLSASIPFAGFAAPEGEVLYGRDVRPILAKNCFHCHGADESTREADSRLDLREEALDMLSPGDPDASELLFRITTDDENDAMPPPETGKSVTPEEIAILRRWIEEGADYEEHWSFQALTEVTPPSLDAEGKKWASTEVDAFVWKRLREKSLTPNDEASREVLIRRLSFDLTGLPPTPAEVKAFVDDLSATAYEDLVDRLLASPRYGERWARHWLDLAQYADTHGFERDLDRAHSWRYRDYVIDSLNADKPWPKFVQEQIAGDLLQPSDPESVVATGFVASGPWDDVGQRLEEDSLNLRMVRNLDRDNMVHNVVQGVLGVTVQCARCHDHKFDPIRASDYYSLQAVFADVERGAVTLPDAAAKTFDEKIAALRGTIIARSDSLDAAQTELERHRETLSDLPELATAFLNLSRRKQETLAYKTRFPNNVETWEVILDYGEARKIGGAFLYPMQVFNAKGRSPGRFFPTRFLLEASNEHSFSKKTVLADHREKAATNPGADFHRVQPPSPIKARYLRLTVLGRAAQEIALAEIVALDPDGKPLRPESLSSNFGDETIDYLRDGWLSTHPFSYREDHVAVALTPLNPSKKASVTLDFGEAHWLDTVHVGTDSPSAKIEVFAGDSTTPLPRLSGWLDPWRDPWRDPWQDANGETFNARSLHPSTLTISVENGSLTNAVALARGTQLLTADMEIREVKNLDPAQTQAWLARPRPSGYPLQWATDLSATRAALVKEVARLQANLERSLLAVATPAERLQLNEWKEARSTAAKNPKTAFALKPLPLARPVSLLARGNETSPTKRVAPRAPDLMTHHPGILDPDLPPRLAFARWVTAPDNSLFWRNIVNRVWMHHFGAGLSTTPDDLGLIGSYPSHPELLDWLATRFREDGSLKNLHRLILTSAAWRQSSATDEAAAAVDGQNRYLARMNRSRLDAEAVHDAHLWLADILNLEPGGPGFRRFKASGTYQPTYHYDQYDPADPNTHRRSIYRHVVRGTRDPMMESLDCADPNLNVAQRVETLTATQALTLVNHAFTDEMTERFAERVARDAKTPPMRAVRIWTLATGRHPDPFEKAVLIEAMHEKGLEFACRLVLNSNAFLYID